MNLARFRAGQYVGEGSLSHTKLADPGLANNTVDGHIVPTATGGSISFTVRNGIKYKTHVFTSYGTMTVSGNPRTLVAVSVRGGGGGGGYRWNWGEPTGPGGAGGIGTGLRVMPNGNSTMSVGGGGSCNCGGGGTGGSGGQSDAFGITAYGGGGGMWVQSPPFGPAGSGGSSTSTTSTKGQTFNGGIWTTQDQAYLVDNSDIGPSYGGSGPGSGWNNGSPSAGAGGAGSVIVRYRWTK